MRSNVHSSLSRFNTPVWSRVLLSYHPELSSSWVFLFFTGGLPPLRRTSPLYDFCPYVGSLSLGTEDLFIFLPCFCTRHGLHRQNPSIPDPPCPSTSGTSESPLLFHLPSQSLLPSTSSLVSLSLDLLYVVERRRFTG